MASNTIEIKNRCNRTQFTVTIEGDGDLILNKMNAVTERQLLDVQRDKAKSTEKPNEWEQVITSIHWLNPVEDFTEEAYYDALKNNKPCISSFGLKKSFGDAVVRNEIDKYKTKFDANVNIIASDNKVPISFALHSKDEKLIPARKGCPVRAVLNRFSGWSATFTVQLMGSVFSIDQIVNIIDLAGFGLGIGSGRSSGFGRYHVAAINGMPLEKV